MQEANQRNQVKCCLEVFMIPTADSTELSQGVPLLWLPLQQLPTMCFPCSQSHQTPGNAQSTQHKRHQLGDGPSGAATNGALVSQP